MYKLIVCDLDETLLNSDKKICQENIDAIKKARDLGVKFVPATGRGYTCIDYVLNTLELYDLENEYAISNNGAIVTENKDFCDYQAVRKNGEGAVAEIIEKYIF